MIQGVIHNNKPLISVIVGWRYGVQEIVALVDTGFTGELKLSPQTASELGLDITHTEPVTLADDKTTNMEASIAVVSMEGTPKMVSVLIAPGMLPIVGVELLRRFSYVLSMNFKENILVLQK